MISIKLFGMEESDLIDMGALINFTGDPFADTGGFVIKYLYLQPQLKEKNIIELIEYVAKIYVEKWEGKLHSFFLNSKITQAAFKGQRKIHEAIKYYQSLIDETEINHEGYCRISGRKTKVFSAGRDNHILSGSGTFINFHHNFESGIFLSKEVLIRMFFVPLGVIQLNDKIALLTSNLSKVEEYFVFQNCKNNLKALSIGKSESILKSVFNIPSNALFGFAEKCINDMRIVLYDEEKDFFLKEEVNLTLYHFTNFGASPEIAIHSMSSLLFKFYAFCQNPKYKREWTKFIRAHYSNSKFKNVIYDEATEIWEGKEKVIYEDYQTWKNTIYDNLLQNKSIYFYFLKWSICHSFSFRIVEIYQINIRNMEKRTIEKIKQLADFIVVGRDSDFITKGIKRLNGEKTSSGLRQYFLKLNSENYLNNAKLPLITVDDYVEYLFPDGSNWRELRDVLLIAIYQKLHDVNISIDIALEEQEEETQN
jgi:CRISPR-associated protein Cst1